MSAPTTRRARGRFRRGSRISSPRNEAVSIPPNANAIVEKKRASLRPTEGMRCAAEKDVAEPNRAKTTAPETTRTIAGIHVATAAALCSHVPYLRPRTFTAEATITPSERERQEEAAALLEGGAPGAPEEERVRGREVEESRKERQVARPVEESRHEARGSLRRPGASTRRARPPRDGARRAPGPTPRAARRAREPRGPRRRARTAPPRRPSRSTGG